MTNKEILNSAAKWALVLGVSMSLLHIAEIKMTLSGSAALLMLLFFEKIFAAGLFVYILYCANREQAKAADEAYGFRRVMNFSFIVAIFSALIVSIASHTYIVNVIGGYGEYADQVLAVAKNMIASQGESSQLEEFNASMIALVEQGKEQVPTIWDSIMSMISSSVLGSLISSAIIYRFYKK